MNIKAEIKGFFYKPGSTKWDIERMISSVVVISLLVGLFFYGQKRNLKLTKERMLNVRYTVATTITSHRNFKSSQPTVDYFFNYSGKRYLDFEKIPDTLEDKIRTTNGRYYVEFSSKNPDNCKLLLLYPVPDSIKAVPEEGWNYLPGFKNRSK